MASSYSPQPSFDLHRQIPQRRMSLSDSDLSHTKQDTTERVVKHSRSTSVDNITTKAVTVSHESMFSNLEAVEVGIAGSRKVYYYLNSHSSTRGSSRKSVSPWHDIPLFPTTDVSVLTCICTKAKNSNLDSCTHLELAQAEPCNPFKQRGYVASQSMAVGDVQKLPITVGILPQTRMDSEHAAILRELDMSSAQKLNLDPSSDRSGMDGPLEVLDLAGSGLLRKPGEVYFVKPIGALIVSEGTAISWKILAVDSADPASREVSCLNDVEKKFPDMFASLRKWLSTCFTQQENGGEVPDCQFSQFVSAMDAVSSAHSLWQLVLQNAVKGSSSSVLARAMQISWNSASEEEKEENSDNRKTWPPSISRLPPTGSSSSGASKHGVDHLLVKSMRRPPPGPRIWTCNSNKNFAAMVQQEEAEGEENREESDEGSVERFPSGSAMSSICESDTSGSSRVPSVSNPEVAELLQKIKAQFAGINLSGSSAMRRQRSSERVQELAAAANRQMSPPAMETADVELSCQDEDDCIPVAMSVEAEEPPVSFPRSRTESGGLLLGQQGFKAMAVADEVAYDSVHFRKAKTFSRSLSESRADTRHRRRVSFSSMVEVVMFEPDEAG